MSYDNICYRRGATKKNHSAKTNFVYNKKKRNKQTVTETVYVCIMGMLDSSNTVRGWLHVYFQTGLKLFRSEVIPV